MDQYYDQEIRTSQVMRLREHIKKIISSSWLSIHRGQVEKRPHDREQRSSIDAKLSQTSQDFGAYFSRLDKRADEQTEQFQQNYFLSFLHKPGILNRVDDIKDLDVESERDALRAIFTQFRMKPSRFATRLDDHFSLLEKAKK